MCDHEDQGTKQTGKGYILENLKHVYVIKLKNKL